MSFLSFQWPIALAGLVLVPLAAAGYVWLQRRRTSATELFANPLLYPGLVDRRPGLRRHVPATLLLLALALLVTGVARPQAAISTRREEATIVLAIDVSRSMLATDVAPSRLAAARAAARAFLAQVPERYRVGIVAFASRPDVVSPATRDRDVLDQAIAFLRAGEGTALGDAIGRSIEVADAGINADASERPPAESETRSPAAILLLSDGAQTQGTLRPDVAARKAAAEKIPIYAVALGTPNGVVERALPGGLRERIRVPPDPQTLRAVASTTGGEFFTAPDQTRLERIYEDLGSRLGRQKQQREVTVALGAAGGVLALIGAFLAELWFRRVPA